MSCGGRGPLRPRQCRRERDPEQKVIAALGFAWCAHCGCPSIGNREILITLHGKPVGASRQGLFCPNFRARRSESSPRLLVAPLAVLSPGAGAAACSAGFSLGLADRWDGFASANCDQNSSSLSHFPDRKPGHSEYPEASPACRPPRFGPPPARPDRRDRKRTGPIAATVTVRSRLRRVRLSPATLACPGGRTCLRPP